MLHSDLEAFLDLAALSPQTQAFHTLAPADAREAFERSTEQLRWNAPDNLSVRHLVAPTRDGRDLPLWLYRPVGESDVVLPLLVYFHGGGFVVGSLQSHDGVCRELCVRSGCAVLSVGYRLAPEHRFPTAFEDGEDALKWLAGHARDLALDIDRVVFGGDSVGATLATSLAIQASRQGVLAPVRAAGQLLCYPVTDAHHASTSRTLFGEGYLLESETLEWFYDNYARTAADRRDWRFSPLLAEDLSLAPPAVILLAGLDPLLDEGRAYAARLQACGVSVECMEEPGMTHDLLRMVTVMPEVLDVYDRLVAGVLGLLDRAVKS